MALEANRDETESLTMSSKELNRLEILDSVVEGR